MGDTRGVVLKLKTHASACQCNIVDSEVRALWKQHTQSYYKLITNQLCGSIRRFAAVSKKIYSRSNHQDPINNPNKCVEKTWDKIIYFSTPYIAI